MFENLPRHIAIIPDGNRRWARKHELFPWDGHAMGAKRFREIIEAAFDLGIPYVTFWATSEDNLMKRTRVEVEALIGLLEKAFTNQEWLEALNNRKIQFRVLGRWREILAGKKIVNLIHRIEKDTAGYNKYCLTILLAYSGKKEMMQAIETIVQKHQINMTEQENITEDIIKNSLWTRDLPPVDLLIRTGEEDDCWAHWSSGFLMWDTADAEFYFTKTLWPDFSAAELKKVLNFYRKRARNRGA